MKLGRQPLKWLQKKAKLRNRGYPVGTIAFYGPDDRRSSKAVASIVPGPNNDPTELRRWFSDAGDIRSDDAILAEVVSFLRDGGVRSIAMVDGIVGCPHEEGIDYPEGEACPHCPFWAGSDGWAGSSRP